MDTWQPFIGRATRLGTLGMRMPGAGRLVAACSGRVARGTTCARQPRLAAAAHVKEQLLQDAQALLDGRPGFRHVSSVLETQQIYSVGHAAQGTQLYQQGSQKQ